MVCQSFVRLGGLAPRRRYEYRVKSGKEVPWAGGCGILIRPGIQQPPSPPPQQQPQPPQQPQQPQQQQPQFAAAASFAAEVYKTVGTAGGEGALWSETKTFRALYASGSVLKLLPLSTSLILFSALLLSHVSLDRTCSEQVRSRFA